ncbi:hypothetical protein J4H86_13995 [Spiractinospora alimapuensis]|uniref:hypothetical protein n=1 Tax=Spiractinospora alimapuensis TaxID=2820884 RepID=UPI001F25C744|nr:hypothetical protein [Spiractinospora alimapuensis]QVQ50081.1 hypothetical protein J4H86_13995 [Spiractinospora alimapuensis]
MTEKHMVRELIPLYSRETWTTTQHPLPEIGEIAEELAAARYEEFTRLGVAHGALSIAVYRRAVAPSYLFFVEAPTHTELVAALDIVDAMGLLSTWAPAVNSATVGDALEEIRGGEFGIARGLRRLLAP